MPYLFPISTCLCWSLLCKWAIRILTMGFALKCGSAVRAIEKIFSSSTHCTTMLTACSNSLIPQIPVPTVPTYQPTTSIPQRLEAIQKYIRDLQYPSSNLQREIFQMQSTNAYFLYTSWHMVDLAAIDSDVKTSCTVASLYHLCLTVWCLVFNVGQRESRPQRHDPDTWNIY